jgi:hypothetical protein
MKEVVEVVDLTDVQKVVCTIAYGTSPLGVKPSHELEEWLVTKEVDCPSMKK